MAMYLMLFNLVYLCGFAIEIKSTGRNFDGKFANEKLQYSVLFGRVCLVRLVSLVSLAIARDLELRK